MTISSILDELTFFVNVELMAELALWYILSSQSLQVSETCVLEGL